MAELAESKMNFAALNKVDPYAKSLIETAAHVALYTFIDNEWERTEVEGTLFVYSRTGEPFHNILIMNRLNMKNQVEPVVEGLDLQLQDPFLLYRNSQGLIYGIWFYDKEECVKIASTLTKIIAQSSQLKSEMKNKNTILTGGNNVDIFSMLTKAQEEYNSKSPSKTHPGPIGQEVLGPHDLNYNLKDIEPTPQCVMDFFAKASNNGPTFGNTKMLNNQSAGMFLSNSRSGPPPGLSRMQSVPIVIPPPQSDVKPLLQKLMSNPAHTVEHIEKQQQAITPQTDYSGLVQNSNSLLSSSNGSDSRNDIGFQIKSKVTANLGNEIGSIGGAGAPQGPKLENKLGFLRISDSPPTTVQTQQFYNSKLTKNHSPLFGDIPLEHNFNHIENHRPLSAPTETQSKPALMPPMMFTTSAKKEDNLEALSIPPTLAFMSTSGSRTTSYPAQPEPLTKNQLLQAVNYLLKHDQDFINKLHEAYVKSFSELVQ